MPIGASARATRRQREAATSVITNGLQARYTFEDTGDTTTLTDVAGPNDATINGMVYDTSNPITESASGSFDGVDDDCIASSSSVSLGTSDPITVTFWFRTATTTSDIFEGAVVLEKSGTPEFGVDPVSDDGGVNVYTSGNNTSGEDIGSFADGANHHLAVTWGNSQDTLEVYADGSLLFTKDPYGDTSTASNVAIRLGHDTVSGFFGGVLDDVRVYDRVLSASEISDIYNGVG